MLQRIGGLPEGVLGMRVVGRLSAADYESELEPAVNAVVASGRKVRLLLELGETYQGIDPGAVVADLGFGSEHFRAFDRMAIVTDVDWVRHGVTLFGPMMPGEIRVFGNAERDGATAWIAADLD